MRSAIEQSVYDIAVVDAGHRYLTARDAWQRECAVAKSNNPAVSVYLRSAHQALMAAADALVELVLAP